VSVAHIASAVRMRIVYAKLHRKILVPRRGEPSGTSLLADRAALGGQEVLSRSVTWQMFDSRVLSPKLVNVVNIVNISSIW